MKTRLFIALIFLIPSFAYAQGVNYLEFNPDYFKTKSLSVAGAGNIYEIFLPSNEFFGGADFWFDNAGNAGTASFELRDENDGFITVKNVSIPHIDPIQGGQRIHAAWDSQIPAAGSKKYRIKISSALPQFRIYYADRIKFLGHNEPHLSDYLNGVAEINGEEQQFSFKYALYETTEYSAPVISNVGWTVVSENQMKLDFNANEPVDFKVEYGPAGQGFTQLINWTGEYAFCVFEAAMCGLTAPVSPNMSYQYLLTVKDSWGNQSQTSGNFNSGQTQTPAPTAVQASPAGSSSPSPAPPSQSSQPSPEQIYSDTIPPAISNLRIVSNAGTSVKIAWTTDEAASSHLLISTPFLITITNVFDPTLELEHVLEAPGNLGTNAAYVATVTSFDPASNNSRASISFTTSASASFDEPAAPGQTPYLLPANQAYQDDENVSVVSSPIGGGSDVSFIEWKTEAGGGSGYRVDIFDENSKLVTSVTAPAGSKNVFVPGLEEGRYSVIVYSNNEGVFEKIDKPVKLEVGENFIDRLLGFWWVLGPLLAGLAYLLWRNRKTVHQ